MSVLTSVGFTSALTDARTALNLRCEKIVQVFTLAFGCFMCKWPIFDILDAHQENDIYFIVFLYRVGSK